jgi:hypothetical protein
MVACSNANVTLLGNEGSDGKINDAGAYYPGWVANGNADLGL